jgi:ribonuclease Z
MTTVQFLGTGTPNPDPAHQGPAAAVVVNGQPYIVDSGPGVVRQAAAAGFKMDQLTHVFFTHLHSDHTLGYPDLIFTPAVTGRTGPLNVCGPVGVRTMTNHILEAWSQDRDTRLHGGEPSVPEAYKVRVQEFEGGLFFEDDNVRVRAFAVEHGKWQNAFGLRFETEDRVIVFSGDTTYSDNLVKNAQGCDVLVHEAYSSAGLAQRTPEWQRYHSTYHTSGSDVGYVASQVKPKLLLLYHLLPFGQPEGTILEEVKEGYDGEVIEAVDLATY